MKIVFLGGCYSDNQDNYFLKHVKGVELALPSNVYQREIIKGLVENNADIYVISCPYLPGFPINFDMLKIFTSPFLLEGKEVGVTAGYNLFFATKDLSAQHAYEEHLNRWYAQNNEHDEKIVLLLYSLLVPQLNAAYSFKNKHDNVEICCIVTDLFHRTFKDLKGSSYPKKIQRGLDVLKLKRLIPSIDKYILLAKGMEEKVPESIDRNIIVEGVVSPKELYVKPEAETPEKVLLYTGSLGEHTSIKELVDAFKLTNNPAFRLVICGAGVYSSYVVEAAKEDHRIIYKGLVNRDKALELQRSATALINPRWPSIRDTPYSFPSKTMEYLTSGTPMIGYKLIGIPSDYYDYYYTIESEGINLLAHKIEEVLLLPQPVLNRKAKEAFDYIVNNKTSKMQTAKIINFLR